MADELTDAERAELDELRAAKNRPTGTIENDTVSLKPTHWLWLANGEVFESNGVMSHYKGIPVVASYEKPAELVNDAPISHVF